LFTLFYGPFVVSPIRLGFSRWIPAASLPSDDQSEQSWVVQVKVVEGLLKYPDGRSAMIWYGASNDGGQLIRQILPKLSAAVEDKPLAWRYSLSKTPHDQCKRLLERFSNRFGSTPQFQDFISES
jgi:hypothetical protein